MWSGLDVRGHVRATDHHRRRGVRLARDLERILNLTGLSCFLCFRSRLYFSIKQLRTFLGPAIRNSIGNAHYNPTLIRSAPLGGSLDFAFFAHQQIPQNCIE